MDDETTMPQTPEDALKLRDVLRDETGMAWELTRYTRDHVTYCATVGVATVHVSSTGGDWSAGAAHTLDARLKVSRSTSRCLDAALFGACATGPTPLAAWRGLAGELQGSVQAMRETADEIAKVAGDG